MSDKSVLLVKEKNIATVTLNRPSANNAIDLNLVKDLYEAFKECHHDASIRAVIFTGNGNMFSAGGDLLLFNKNADNLGPLVTDMTTYFHLAITLMQRMEKPIVSAINGTAAGGGLSLALSGDIILSSDQAKFSCAYTAAGLSPDGSMTYVLPRLIGLKRTKELMITNRRFLPDEALNIGMIDQIVSHDELAKVSKDTAINLANGATKAYGAVKSLLAETFSSSLESHLEQEARQLNIRAQSSDGKEGVRAFIEKRKANFTGK
ncbi:MAG: enoyl-CoA hydratase [Rickettsiales bacterium]|nr:enoyl-CoA hydratase [Rickettsiales bacterium]|tara:strand:- start:2022 stop:2810 length:789 start_codon:yes stop_codon:yes gene_type:complete